MGSHRFLLFISIQAILIFNAFGDIYLHNTRGSNNRLKEATATRTNANRLFDSQNNNRGGYNVGDKLNQAANTSEQQYQLKFFQSSATFLQDKGRTFLTMEWTNQHGCGGNANTDPNQLNCELVLQYMCQEDDSQEFRDGTSTDTAKYSGPKPDETNRTAATQRKAADASPESGVQEQWEWYDKCATRDRNKGLFIAERNLRVNTAIATRQNPNADRYGYECTEERDYWPYWHPSPWKDIAVFTDNLTLCSTYKSNSFNVLPKHECIEMYADDEDFIKHNSKWNNEKDCKANGGNWTALYSYLEKATQYASQSECEADSSRKWAIPYDAKKLEKQCLVMLSEPECLQAPWTRVNHLGSADNDGVFPNYTWTLPYFPSKKDKKCVFRLRYNISTGDYDPFRTDSRNNGVNSPVRNNPIVDMGYDVKLQLAMNPDQFGRTFQDRSHIFILRPRPAGLEDVDIYNVNVRGKKGNPVQTYPAVPYDFSPSQLRLNSTDAIHFQWTGSNTHNNGGGGGDGITGTEGLGNDGFDRHNLVEVNDVSDNYPSSFSDTTFWNNSKVLWLPSDATVKQMTPRDLAVYFATSGYYYGYECNDQCVSSKSSGLDSALDTAPASFEGALLQLNPGNYSFMSSRNHAPSRRSQKGTIVVDYSLSGSGYRVSHWSLAAVMLLLTQLL